MRAVFGGCSIVFIVLCFDRCLGGYSYLYLDSLAEGQAITTHLIRRVQTYSEIGCSRSCLDALDCHAISYECKVMAAGGQGICDLISEERGSAPYTVAADTAMCTMTVKVREVMLGAQVIASISHNIVDMINNVLNMCTATSQADIAVVTKDAVYFYDDHSALATGSCRSMALTSFFSGFPGIPDVTHWDAILTVSNSYIDVFTDSKVFRWAVTSMSLNPMGSYPIFRSAYLRAAKSGVTATYVPVSPTWGVYRSTLGSNDVYFYEAVDEKFCFYSNQGPKETNFHISNTLPTNQNGKSINPWWAIPRNTVALTAEDNTGINFVGITDDFVVFHYALPDPQFMKTDPVVTTQKFVF